MTLSNFRKLLGKRSLFSSRFNEIGNNMSQSFLITGFQVLVIKSLTDFLFFFSFFPIIFFFFTFSHIRICMKK